MKFFGRGDDKEKKAMQTNIISSHVAGRAQARGMGAHEALRRESLGRGFFLQEDEQVDYILREYCPYLIPAFSRLNATSKIDRERDRRLMQLYFKDLLLHLQMELAEDGDAVMRSLIKSLGINAEYRILDAMGGYRGRLVTEEIERTTVRVEQPKKKGFL